MRADYAGIFICHVLQEGSERLAAALAQNFNSGFAHVL